MEDFTLPLDTDTWFRCEDCEYQYTEDKAEVCERCNKMFCTDCAKHGGYVDMAGVYWGGGTGYICPRCVPIHVVDTEVAQPVKDKNQTCKKNCRH